MLFSSCVTFFWELQIVNALSTICNSQETVTQELINIKKDLNKNGYPMKLIDQTVNKRRNQANRPKEDIDKTGPTINIPYVKGVSKKIKRIGKQYNLQTIFRSKDSIP